MQVGSIRWLCAQPDPRAAFKRLQSGEIPEALGTVHGILSVVTEEMPGVFSFKCFRRAFCYELIEEIERRAGATGSTNLVSYACVLQDIGFQEAIDRFCEVVITPIAELLFPRQGGNTGADHRAYIIKYAAGEELALQKHMDMSDVTLNINMGKAFTGGETYFDGWQRVTDSGSTTKTHSYEGKRQKYVDHNLGSALFHAGTQVNGTERITGGEKWNLIVWRAYTERTGWLA